MALVVFNDKEAYKENGELTLGKRDGNGDDLTMNIVPGQGLLPRLDHAMFWYFLPTVRQVPALLPFQC